MSKWNQHRDDLLNSDAWKNIIKHIDTARINSIEDVNHKAEAVRFKSVIAYVAELLKLVNPEVIPEDIWSDLRGYIESCSQNLPPIKDVKNHSGNYTHLNEILDQFLQEFLRYISTSKESAQAAQKAFLAYEEIVKTSLSNLENSLSEIESKTKKLDALEKQIESLLPGATSAGLAHSFHEQKIAKGRKAALYSCLFAFTVITIFGLAVVGVVHDYRVIEPVNAIPDVTFLNQLYDINRWIGKIPVFLSIASPLLWLAIVFSKRRSENARLQEEYAHKEAVAKSFDSYKKQVEAIADKDNQLLPKLLDVAITALEFNPSKTLEKRHGDSLLGFGGENKKGSGMNPRQP